MMPIDITVRNVISIRHGHDALSIIVVDHVVLCGASVGLVIVARCEGSLCALLWCRRGRGRIPRVRRTARPPSKFRSG